MAFIKLQLMKNENHLFDILEKFQHEAPFTHASNFSVTLIISILNRLYIT